MEQQVLQELLASLGQQGRVDFRANLGPLVIMVLQGFLVHRDRRDRRVLQGLPAILDSKVLLVHLGLWVLAVIQVQVDPQVIKDQLDLKVLEGLKARLVLLVN